MVGVIRLTVHSVLGLVAAVRARRLAKDGSQARRQQQTQPPQECDASRGRRLRPSPITPALSLDSSVYASFHKIFTPTIRRRYFCRRCLILHSSYCCQDALRASR